MMGRRLAKPFIAAMGLLMITSLATWQWSGTLCAGEPSADNIARLVEQLGDRRFSVRRQATSRLIDLGVASIEALRRGVRSSDREVSFRSRHVLSMVRENDFQRRLRAFARSRDASDDYQLPSWTRFAKDVGTGSEARSLFVDMQQAEPRLLASLEKNPEAIGEALAERIGLLQANMSSGREADLPSLGTITTILFILNGQDVKLPQIAIQSVGSFFRYPAFSQAIESGSRRELLRKMLGTWIERSEGWDAYHAMFLSMQYGIARGIEPAKRILRGELQEKQNQTYFLGYALLTMARFGDSSHYPIIEPLLENETPYGGTIAVAGNKKFRTQIRDIALATLVHLAKLDHEDFGFTRYRTHASQVFHPSSVAFEDDERRDKWIQKWLDDRQAQ